ncbi:tetratricopeptide repeat protein [Actinocatenispora rupis]|nr:tetratricopeptide repeat protein [Actinocatenispora rupis]
MLLGLHPGTTITAEPVAALAETDRRQAARHLDALADAHLLEETAPGRYALHDLLRVYARRLAARLPDAERTSALRRLVGWYARTAHCAATAIGAARLLAPGPAIEPAPLDFDAEDAALAWFDREQGSLDASMSTAAGLGLHEDVCRLAVARQHHLVLRHHADDRAATFLVALTSARVLDDLQVLARVLCGLGSARFDQRRYDDAQASFQEALETYLSLGQPAGAAGVRLDLACVHAEKGDHDGAIGEMTRAYHEFVEVGDHRRQGLCLVNIGEINQRRGNLTEALRYSLAALPVTRAHNNAYVQITLLGNLAGIHRQTGDLQQALRYHREQQEMARAVRAELMRAEGLLSYGDTLAALGRYADARARWRTAHELLHRHDHPLAATARARLGPVPHQDRTSVDDVSLAT